jgi:hypothetical protein
VSTSKKNNKSREEMSPEEKEAEHVRRLREEVDAVKSGVLRRGKEEKDSGNTEEKQA